MQNFKVYEELSIGNSGAKIQRVRQHNSLIFQASHEFNSYIPQIQASARRYIALLSKLSHPNIIKYQHCFYAGNMIYLITELCYPYSLQRLVKKDRMLPLYSLCLFSQDLKDALFYLHYNGYLHNDFCANNFILSSNGVLKLIEFEPTIYVAKAAALTVEDIEFSIRKNGYLHRAPETLLEQGCYSYASDLYSLGCTLYFIAFGRYPYKELDKGDYYEYARSVLAKGAEHLKSVLPPVEARQTQLPTEFYELLYTLLQPVPFERAAWDDVCQNKMLAYYHECAPFKLYAQPIYCAALLKMCQIGIFGDEKLNLQFDKRGGISQKAGDAAPVKAPKIKQVVEYYLQRFVNAAEQDKDSYPIEPAELSYAPDMTIKQVKKQTYLYHLADYIGTYYNELYELLETYKFDVFIVRWMRYFVPIILSRNNNLKYQKLIYIEGQIDASSAANASYNTLYKLQGDEYLSYLEILLKQAKTDNPFKFDTADAIVDLFNYVLQIMHCTYYIREKLPNESKINPKLFVSYNAFERCLICLAVLLFEYRDDFVQQFATQQVDGIFEVMRFIQENKLHESDTAGLALYCECLTLIFTLLMNGVLTPEYIAEYMGYSFIQLHLQFTYDVNSKFLSIDFLNASRETFVYYLSRCVIFFTFCTNLALQVIATKYSGKLRYQPFKQICFTDYLIAAYNIFMFIHYDNFVSALKQKSGLLVTQLPISCTVASSLALAALTDLRLHSIIQFKLVIPAYFDFPKVLHDVFATRNMLYALIQAFLLERFSVLDVESEQFTLSYQPASRTEKFVYDNYYRLLNLQQFPAQDDQLLALVAALLAAIFATDMHEFRCYKNCSNAVATKFAYFIGMPDAHFERNLDEMVYRCGIKHANYFLLYSVGQLILSIQLLFDGIMTSVRRIAVRGTELQIVKLETCANALKLVSQFLCIGSYYHFMLITTSQAKNLEEMAAGIVSSVVLRQMPPNSDVQAYIENCAEQLGADEVNYYVYLVLTLLRGYLNFPLAKDVIGRLFYVENRQAHGLYTCLLNLSKDPLRLCYVAETSANRGFKKLLDLLRIEPLSIFETSLNKLIHVGPILPYIKLNYQFMLSDGVYRACSDNFQAGLLGSHSFTEEQVNAATQQLYYVLSRLLTSKSIFSVSFARMDKRAQTALRLASVSLDLGVKSEPLRDVAEKCLKQPPSIARLACEIVGRYVRADSEYWLHHMSRLGEYAQKPDVYISIIKSCLQVCREVAEAGILETQSDATKYISRIKYVDIADLIASCALAAAYFFYQALFGYDGNVITKLQVIALYYILFLKFSTVDYAVIYQLLEAFGAAVSDGRAFDPVVFDAILDIMQQVSPMLVAAGWSNFQKISAQIQACVDERQRFRLEYIRMNSIPVKWPDSWFQ